MSNYRKDCLGLCCCAEDSYFFCKGKMVSVQQREYIGNVQVPIGDNVSFSSRRSADVVAIRHAIAKRSILERCCGFRIGPVVLSKMGRTVILFLYLLAFCIGAYGVSEMDIYFDDMLFVSKSSDLYKWFNLNEQYFTRGTWVPTQIFVQNTEVPFDTTAI